MKRERGKYKRREIKIKLLSGEEKKGGKNRELSSEVQYSNIYFANSNLFPFHNARMKQRFYLDDIRIAHAHRCTECTFVLAGRVINIGILCKENLDQSYVAEIHRLTIEMGRGRIRAGGRKLGRSNEIDVCK